MESAATANTSKSTAPIAGQYLGQDLVSDIVITKSVVDSSAPLKIRLPIKIAAFCFSVVTLSWFFEGTRQCKEALNFPGLAYLVGGALMTLLLIGLQAFFIYCEERSKGARTRKIDLFDKWYLFLASKQKGDYTNRG